MLINVKMPTIVGILTFMSMFFWSVELSMKKVLQPWGLVYHTCDHKDKRAILQLTLVYIYMILTSSVVIINSCCKPWENLVSWLAQFVFINLYVNLKTGLNWPTS